MRAITIEGPKIADMAKKRKLAQDVTDSAAKVFALPRESIVIILDETSPECVATAGELVYDSGGAKASVEVDTGRPCSLLLKS